MKLNTWAAIVGIVVLMVAPGRMSLLAQAPAPLPSPTADTPTGPDILSQADLAQLVAPIALYPDPMLALILPAATVPTDIVLASRWLNDGNSPDNIDAQSWDDSVKSLARYPDVLQMMDENLDWTNQLGAAVLAQQADVMTAIQAQRAKAQSLGNLQTTAQQQVVSDNGAIQIVPADPQIIYVPIYDPQVIYVQPAPVVPFITFGAGLAIGIWLNGDCDWHNHYFYRGGYYRPGYGWGYRNVTINNNYIWRPNPNRPRPRPPYRPGRPGGQLPGWQRPPNWGKPRPPGNGRPPGNDNGNRPGGPGNRPSGPGNKPGNDRPSIQPVKPPGGKGPGHEKPKPKPGTTRPAPNEKPNKRPSTTQPAKPEAKPKPEVRPQPKPVPTRPAPTRPTPKPERPHQDFDRQRPSTKRPASHPTPTRTARPAPGGGRGDRSR